MSEIFVLKKRNIINVVSEFSPLPEADPSININNIAKFVSEQNFPVPTQKLFLRRIDSASSHESIF